MKCPLTTRNTLQLGWISFCQMAAPLLPGTSVRCTWALNAPVTFT